MAGCLIEHNVRFIHGGAADASGDAPVHDLRALRSAAALACRRARKPANLVRRHGCCFFSGS
jgi:hypothetical protein